MSAAMVIFMGRASDSLKFLHLFMYYCVHLNLEGSFVHYVQMTVMGYVKYVCMCVVCV